jgi:hypothetical protein
MPSEGRERRARAPRPGAPSTTAGPRRCPRCRLKTLEFAPRVAVIVPPSPARRACDDRESSKQRLHYEQAWVCTNAACRYLRLVIG